MNDYAMLEKRLLRFNRIAKRARRKKIYKGIKRKQFIMLAILAKKKKLSKKRLIKLMGIKRKRALKVLHKAVDAAFIEIIREEGQKPKFQLTSKGKEHFEAKKKIVAARRKKVIEHVTSCLSESEKKELNAITKKILAVAKKKRLAKKETLAKIKEHMENLPEEKRVAFALNCGRHLVKRKKMRKLLRRRKKQLMMFTLMKKGPISIKKLHKVMGIRRKKMLRVLCKARRAGLVRVVNCRGRRRVILTPKGRKRILRRIIKITRIRTARRTLIMKEIRDALTKEEFATLMKSMAKIRKHMTAAKRPTRH